MLKALRFTSCHTGYEMSSIRRRVSCYTVNLIEAKDTQSVGSTRSVYDTGQLLQSHANDFSHDGQAGRTTAERSISGWHVTRHNHVANSLTLSQPYAFGQAICHLSRPAIFGMPRTERYSTHVIQKINEARHISCCLPFKVYMSLTSQIFRSRTCRWRWMCSFAPSGCRASSCSPRLLPDR